MIHVDNGCMNRVFFFHVLKFDQVVKENIRIDLTYYYYDLLLYMYYSYSYSYYSYYKQQQPSSIIKKGGGGLERGTAVCFKSEQFRHLRCIIETRCPNTAGVFIYLSVLFQILSAFQRQESTRRHATGSHRSLLGLIKTFFFSCLKKKKNQKKKTLHFLKGQ